MKVRFKAPSVQFLLDVSQTDRFIHELLSVTRKVYRDGGKSVDEDIRTYLLRNDFMTTENDQRILQVEINTISAGFAGIIERLSVLHRSNRRFYKHLQIGEYPKNKPCESFAAAIADAVALHNTKWGRSADTILFVVEEHERNFVDQYTLEYSLAGNHGITVVRKSLSQLSAIAAISEEGFLKIEDVEIPLVYFRSGYDPEHYLHEHAWSVRELIEKAKCVKIPTLLGQLAGTKKVQQMWFSEKETVLTRFGFSDTEISAISEVFAFQTDPSVDVASRNAAVEHPQRWILKPQREGGGHNLHGSDLKEALLNLGPDELAQYVLMEKMTPSTAPALVIDTNATASGGYVVPMIIEEAVCELGIFSVFIPESNRDDVCGHLLRTKEKTITEGGVNVGYAFLDTICLV